MSDRAIGLLELTSVASGFQALDAMLKAAASEVLLARSICSGKYLILVGGDVSSVTASVEAGAAVEPFAVINSEVIARVHEKVFPALSGATTPVLRDAFGCLETFSVVTTIRAADAAVKAADVELIELRAAMALGGKAFVTLTGSVSNVQAAVDAGRAVAREEGLLVNAVVIGGPHPALLAEVV
ncbi:MAG: BMC domain-containing protein [Fimbriimonadaceae bacterium]|nr:BMC domain-containing protein [Fimbriimonadaceae bacterium]